MPVPFRDAKNLEHLRRPEHRVVVTGRRSPWPQLEIAFGQLGVRCRIRGGLQEAAEVAEERELLE